MRSRLSPNSWRGLKAGGVDVAVDRDRCQRPGEIRAAAAGSRCQGRLCPTCIPARSIPPGKTMMGLPPKDIHGVVDGFGRNSPVAVGANCGVGASDILASLLDMSEADPSATIVIKGNCGIPEFRGDPKSSIPEHSRADGRLRPSSDRWRRQDRMAAAAAHHSSTWPRCARPSTATSHGPAPYCRDDRRDHRPNAQQARSSRRRHAEARAPRTAGINAVRTQNRRFRAAGSDRTTFGPQRSSISRRTLFRISRSSSAFSAVSEPLRSFERSAKLNACISSPRAAPRISPEALSS